MYKWSSSCKSDIQEDQITNSIFAIQDFDKINSLTQHHEEEMLLAAACRRQFLSF